MTRLEGDAARRAFLDPAIVLEGGLDPLAAGFVLLLMEHAEVLHLACHGKWMANPWASAVMLGPKLPCAFVYILNVVRYALGR